MGVKVATPCLQWLQPSVSHSPSSSQTLASAISSPSSKQRCIASNEASVICRYANKLDRSAVFGGQQLLRLHRSRSSDLPKSRPQTLRRACSASLASFSDEEFSKKMEELALRFQLSDGGLVNSSMLDEGVMGKFHDTVQIRGDNMDVSTTHGTMFGENQMPFDPLRQPSSILERDEVIPASIEMKANSAEIPMSLRIIKRKKQWGVGLRDAGESAYSSVRKAFSSMVFIIRELHSHTLLMRESLLYEDLQGILSRVQNEMHASFVWLFQQVFSQTPTLMVYVMILLANYSVYSVSNNAAIAGMPPAQAYAATVQTVTMVEDQGRTKKKFDSSAVKTFKLYSSSGKTSSIGGSNGGGGKYRPVASGTGGDGRFQQSSNHQTFVPDGASSIGNPSRTDDKGSVSGQITPEEMSLWNSIVEEASTIQTAAGRELLDDDTMQRLVSPINVKIETDDYSEYLKMELLYQTELAQEPNNPLLLANYAQFLYLVCQDYDRAEDYFKRAAQVEPKDAEALNKYANFLWQVKKDLWAAEETYLEAIDIEPDNSYYAANYAHFLWNTGGEDTCFPLSSPESASDIEL